MNEQTVEEAIKSNPDFQDLVAETEAHQQGLESQQQPEVPEGASAKQLEAARAEKLFEWWRTSEYANEPLSIEQVHALYEQEEDVIVARFEWDSCPEFSLSHLIVNGWLSQTAKFPVGEKDELTITFRSIDFETAREIEKEAQTFARDEDPNINVMRNKVVSWSLSHAWTHLNGAELVDLAKERFGDALKVLDEGGKQVAPLSDIQLRARFIDSLAQDFVDQASLAYGEFRRRTTAMMKGTLQGN